MSVVMEHETKAKVSSGAYTVAYTLPVDARAVANRMSAWVCYPRRINDVGRTVEVRRGTDGHYHYEIRQKRYLGRGTYARSAVAIGTITAIDGGCKVSGSVEYGQLTLRLYMVMTAFIALSLGLLWTTILYAPIALLLMLVMAMQWSYLRYDRQLLHYLMLTGLIHKPKDETSA